jgi:hypothetical protein
MNPISHLRERSLGLINLMTFLVTTSAGRTRFSSDVYEHYELVKDLSRAESNQRLPEVKHFRPNF